MKNIIFDLDGTLGDTLPLCIDAFKKSISPFLNKKISVKEITRYFGISEDGIIKTFLPDHEEEGMSSFISHYKKLLNENPDPFPGVHKLLETLKNNGHFITMVTGKNLKTALITLEQYDIAHYFSDIYPGSPTGEVKDHCINKLISKHSLNKQETVYIGDAVSDVNASRNCGISIIAAGWASTADIPALKAAKPDYLFTSFEDFSNFFTS